MPVFQQINSRLTSIGISMIERKSEGKEWEREWEQQE